jgi:ammonia channel protein AmtB
MYRKLCDRTFAPTNLTKVVTGTLIILITGLFINGGAGGQLTSAFDEAIASPNAIVMNTVISSATSGLTLMIMTQYHNTRHVDKLVQQTGLFQNYNI